MLRIFTIVLLLTLPALAVALEPKFHADLDARIKTAGETTEMRARFAGEMGKPLSIQVNDQADTKIEAKFTAVEGATQQYMAHVKIIRNGKVVSQPTLISLYGQSCDFEVSGDDNGVRMSLKLTPR